MNQQLIEGITVDVCSEDGMWLDKGELAIIVGAVRSEQEARAKRVVRRAALTEMSMQGAARERAFLGGVWLSAFLR